MKPRVLFLYSEIAEYFVTACEVLSQEAEVFVIRWSVNSEAPFEFNASKEIKLLDRDRLDDKGLIAAINRIDPNLIFCSGWLDKGYLKVIRSYSGKVPTVLTMDNRYTGKVRQLLAVFLARFSFLKYFSNAWVPGQPQFAYAKRLGFKSNEIKTGFYTANTPFFYSKFEFNLERKKQEFPKRFLYLGRYVEHKGIFDLWNAYKMYREQGGTWELWCVGTGNQWENRLEMEGLTHFGFKQASEIPAIVANCGAYILPSHFEPWGVSVHEMAASGLPLLLSSNVGCIDEFLEIGENGYSFESGDDEDICNKLNKIAQLSDDCLRRFGYKSVELSKRNSPEKWAVQALTFLN